MSPLLPPGDKFVLDLAHDPKARAAMWTYIDECERAGLYDLAHGLTQKLEGIGHG